MLHHSVPPKLHQSWNEARSAIKELLGEGDRTHLNELLLELRILLLSNLSSHLVFEFGKSCSRMIQVTSSRYFKYCSYFKLLQTKQFLHFSAFARHLTLPVLPALPAPHSRLAARRCSRCPALDLAPQLHQSQNNQCGNI